MAHYLNAQPRSRAQAGFQVPAVMGIILALTLVSTTLFNSVKSSQLEHSSDREFQQAKTLAQNAIFEAESQLQVKAALPVTVHEVGPDPNPNGENLRVWASELESYQMTYSQDGFVDRTIDWWDQGSIWWQTNATASQVMQSSQYVIEYANRITTGQDLGQQQEYKGDAMRLIFRVTGAGFANRDTKAIKQSTYSKVYYQN